MTQILLDANLASKLNDLKSSAELCDPTGRVIGRFVPVVDWSEWEPVSDGISKEELQRRLHSNEKRYSTAEVLAHLEKQ
jgi:hypothetical protein